MACRFAWDVFVKTKNQVNKMIRMKAKYDKSTFLMSFHRAMWVANIISVLQIEK